MSVKLARQPICVNCGCKVARRTDHVRFTEITSEMKPVDGKEVCRTKAEAQRFVNAPIVSVSYSDVRDSRQIDPKTNDWLIIDRIVTGVSTWDGESYIDAWFHNGTCRARWAYKMAKKAWPGGYFGNVTGNMGGK